MKSLMIVPVGFAITLCLSQFAQAQSPPSVLLPAAGLQADDAFRALGNEFQTDRTLDEAYRFSKHLPR